MKKTDNYINKSNDNTFNLVIKHHCYKDKNKVKTLLLVKHGGLVTTNSISKPEYRVLSTNDYIHGRMLFTSESVQQALEQYHQRYQKIENFETVKVDNIKLKELLIDFGLYNVMVRNDRMLSKLIIDVVKSLEYIQQNSQILAKDRQSADLIDLLCKSSKVLSTKIDEQKLVKLVKMMYNKWYMMVNQFSIAEIPNTILPDVIYNEKQMMSNVTTSLNILLNFTAV